MVAEIVQLGKIHLLIGKYKYIYKAMGAGRVIPARGQGFETVCIVQQTEGKRRTKIIKSHKCDMTKKDGFLE